MLDPEGKYINHWISRDSCTFFISEHFSVPFYFKDLSKLGRNLANVIILDNSPKVFVFQPENGAYITSWFGSKDDEELERMQKFLMTLKRKKDVRPYIKEVFQSKKQFDTIDPFTFFLP